MTKTSDLQQNISRRILKVDRSHLSKLSGVHINTLARLITMKPSTTVTLQSVELARIKLEEHP